MPKKHAAEALQDFLRADRARGRGKGSWPQRAISIWSAFLYRPKSAGRTAFFAGNQGLQNLDFAEADFGAFAEGAALNRQDFDANAVHRKLFAEIQNGLAVWIAGDA